MGLVCYNMIMKIYIVEGIAGVGKTSVVNQIRDNVESCYIVPEELTLLPIIKNKDPKVAKDHLLGILNAMDNDNDTVDYLIFDRFHFTHAFRTGSDLRLFSEIEGKLAEMGEVTVLLLTLPEDLIAERLRVTMSNRGDDWKMGAMGAETFDEKVEYYVNQQNVLKESARVSALNVKQVDASSGNWSEIVLEL